MTLEVEKTIIENIMVIKEELKRDIHNRNISIQFYEEFTVSPSTLSKLGIIEQNVLVIEKEQVIKGEVVRVYQICDALDKTPILSIDAYGKVIYDIKYIERKKQELGKYYEKAELKDIENAKEKLGLDEEIEKRENIQENSGINDEKKLKEDTNRKSFGIDRRLLEIELGLKPGEIQYFSEVRRTEVEDMHMCIPCTRKTNNIVFIKLNEEDKILIVGKNEENKYEKIEGIEESKSTFETTRDMGINGENIEKENIKGLTKVKSTQYAYGYNNNGPAGIPEFKKYRWNKQLGEYSLATTVETKNQEYKPTQIRESMEHTRNTYLKEETLKYDEREEAGDTKIEYSEIEDSTVSIERLIQEAANRCKVGTEAFKKVYEKAEGKTPEEKIDNAEEEINQQYIGDSQRTRI